MSVRPNALEHGRYWDATLNVVGGCEIVDTSCYFCYAPPDAAGIQTVTGIELYDDTTMWKDGRWTWNGRLTVAPPDHPAWSFPLDWPGAKNPVLGPGTPSIVWIGSMADIFHPGRPPEAVDRILSTVALSRHIGLVLTKHPDQMVAYFRDKPEWWRRRFLLGFSAGEQRWWNVRWKIIRPLAVNGWPIFTSIQPMLGPVVLPADFLRLARWVICGGEQSPGHRYMDPDWARGLRDQCKGANPPLAFFVKQMTRGWRPPDLLFNEFPEA
jgi:protein gp37